MYCLWAWLHSVYHVVAAHILVHLILLLLQAEGLLCSLHVAALFQSLLYEACGRTVNPVFGAVGLLGSGNWQLCQAAVETVLKGGSLRPPHPLKLSSSSLPQGLQSSTQLENPVATNEIWDCGIQNVLPSHPSPKLFNGHEFHNSKSSLEGIGFMDRNLQRAHEGHKEQKNVHSGVRGDLNGSTCTTAQELQQQRMAQGNAPHLSTWPGAVSLVRFCPSKDQTNSLQVKGEQALGMSSYKQMDAAMEGGMSECHNNSIQIIAPVARRVKPCLRAAQHANGKAVPKSEPQEIFAAGLVTYGSKHQPELELDLTLKVQDAKGDSPATGFRVTSPSCESVISEGSVTSHSRQVVQSQPLISSWAQIERPSPAVVPLPLHHKLLPLLS